MDRRKGLDWLTYAAQQGQVEAQELLGMEQVKGGETERDWAKGRGWDVTSYQTKLDSL
ncbi:hypothetical protein PVT67_00770 [Gallaecimonas kandeliae]|uniref:hypothetical protein n=1 Tax=Gallaecimonas kandeliae TaxID=3029055 RepID=UPI0026494C47|nr:hypothetical protein [Gallaecimonas kandeliae]WKE65823.1 hypothetical protein PVT67_00770 [Gallaecimonas kandeliae]